MAFKRYDGFVGSAPQKKMDNGLPKCPFCGEHPHWLLDLQSGFTATMTCMCEKCGGKLYSENHGFSFDDNLRIVDVGSKNLNNLPLNSVYHIKSLNTIAQNTFDNGGRQSNSSTGGFETAPHTTYTPSYTEQQSKNNKTAVAVISVISIILFIGIMVWALLPGGGGNKVDVVVNSSSMQVEELFGTYTATVTGKITNNSSSTLDYVQITISLYDSAGNVVGTAIDNQLNLGAGETWNFSAMGMSSTTRPVSFKVTDVTYY